MWDILRFGKGNRRISGSYLFTWISFTVETSNGRWILITARTATYTQV